MVRQVKVKLKGGHGYAIDIGSSLLEQIGGIARQRLSSHCQRIALISNPRVFNLYGDGVIQSLRSASFSVRHWLMGEGERFKTLRTAGTALNFLSDTRLERSDAVVALGGGVVGDLGGFAAALYLRGIDFIQVPTTLLAQIDSSVGGKTGVNTATGKNLVGAFHQPRHVVIDIATLNTLPRRELTAGWCEAIKQGAAGDAELFQRTVRFLEADQTGSQPTVNKKREKELARIIADQCAFKAGIVTGDEREDLTRTDARSRRILNFGHTVGHALESVTRYRRFRHGEAVGYGVMAAGEISKTLGLLPQTELELLRRAIRLAGRLPSANDVDVDAVCVSLRSDKKSIAGKVRWVLLERLGVARVVEGSEVPDKVIRSSVRSALKS